MTITPKEAMELDIWLELAKLKELNPWAVNEGLMSDDDSIELTVEEFDSLIS